MTRSVAAELVRSRSWVIIAPRGDAVDPDVYWSSARWSRRIRGRRQSPARAGSTSSIATVVIPGPTGPVPATALRTMAMVGRESAMIASSARLRRPECAGYAGTATAPAARVA